MRDTREFDVALTAHVTGMRIRFPAPVSKALAARGFNRATVAVTEEGILVRPYVSTVADASGSRVEIALPEGWGS
jgi:hypothetical protein